MPRRWDWRDGVSRTCQRLYGYLPPEARQREKSHWEADPILVLIALIMLTGLVYDGGRIAAHPNDLARSFGSPATAAVLIGAGSRHGAGEHELRAAGEQRGLAAEGADRLVFLNLLPPSKHFHIITAIPNIFFAKLEPKGQFSSRISKMSHASELRISISSRGNKCSTCSVARQCGRCSSHCPATATKKPLAPRQLLLDLRDYLYAHQDEIIEAGPSGQRRMARNRWKSEKISSAR